MVSPDHRSRAEINERIHNELQSRGVVSRNEHSTTVLVPRQEMIRRGSNLGTAVSG
jgi:hypothetical protein